MSLHTSKKLLKSRMQMKEAVKGRTARVASPTRVSVAGSSARRWPKPKAERRLNDEPPATKMLGPKSGSKLKASSSAEPDGLLSAGRLPEDTMAWARFEDLTSEGLRLSWLVAEGAIVNKGSVGSDAGRPSLTPSRLSGGWCQQTLRGGVFVTGRKEGCSQNEAQIIKFDPVSCSEVVLGVLQHKDYAHSWTSLGCVEDRLILVGGAYNPNTISVSSFNVVTRRPQALAMMKEPRGGCAVASSRHELLVCGGRGEHTYNLASCEVLYVGSNKWHAMPNLNQARCLFQVVWLSSGEIFAMGGYDFDGDETYFDSVEFLTRRWVGEGAIAEPWRYVAPMLVARSNFGAASIAKKILIAGGFNGIEGDLNSAEMFAPATERGQWTQVQPMRSATCIYSGVVSDGAVLMFGYDIKEKIQRLSPKDSETLDRWIWDEIDALQSIYSCSLATCFK